jgi:hypothetical protein
MQSAQQMPLEIVLVHKLVVTSVKGAVVFSFFVIGVVESGQLLDEGELLGLFGDGL